MSVKQISVFLENKPGNLNGMTQLLADNKINIRALSLAETTDFGIARIIVDDVYETMNILKDAGFVCRLTSVIAVKVPDADAPGGLNQILRYFTAVGINLEYMYAFTDSGHDDAYMIFRVEDTEAAEEALAGKGLKMASQEELADL